MSLRVGRVTLDEGPMRSFEESWSDTGRSVTLSGILFSEPTRTRDRMAALHDDILGLPLSLVPVMFDVKSHRNGYYRVDSSKSSIIDLSAQAVLQLTWEITLTRQGGDNEVDLESRLAGPTNRLNDHALAGERWHAPAGSSSAYWVGSATPAEVTRTGEDGPIVVYRTLPFNDDPHWYSLIENYGLGRVRILDTGERAGTGVDLPVSDWSLENSLARFYPSNSTGAFNMRWHNGAGWGQIKRFDLTAAGVPLGAPLSVSVLHNEYERATVRCLWDVVPSGRIYADITLRRGSRFVEILMRSSFAMTLGAIRGTPEIAVAGAGLIRAASNDVDGNRYIIGSLRSFTSDLNAGSISKDSTTVFDAIIGAEIGGAVAVAGDTADDLMGQYVGVPSETVQAVRR